MDGGLVEFWDGWIGGCTLVVPTLVASQNEAKKSVCRDYVGRLFFGHDSTQA